MTHEEKLVAARERSRRWRERHPGAATAHVRKWRADPANAERERSANARTYVENADAFKARARKRYHADPARAYAEQRARLAVQRADPATAAALRDWHRNYLRRWRALHAERQREYVRSRRARRVGAPGRHTLAEWMARVALHGWRCRYCSTALTAQTLTLDHAIPLSRGGSEWPANLLPACLSCNSRKHDHTLHEFLGAHYGEV